MKTRLRMAAVSYFLRGATWPTLPSCLHYFTYCMYCPVLLLLSAAHISITSWPCPFLPPSNTISLTSCSYHFTYLLPIPLLLSTAYISLSSPTHTTSPAYCSCQSLHLITPLLLSILHSGSPYLLPTPLLLPAHITSPTYCSHPSL